MLIIKVNILLLIGIMGLSSKLPKLLDVRA